MEIPKIGERYKHFKGGEYRIVMLAKDCENPKRTIVVYEQLYQNEFPRGTVWIRSLEDFAGFKELKGEKLKRFVLIK